MTVVKCFKERAEPSEEVLKGGCAGVRPRPNVNQIWVPGRAEPLEALRIGAEIEHLGNGGVRKKGKDSVLVSERGFGHWRTIPILQERAFQQNRPVADGIDGACEVNPMPTSARIDYPVPSGAVRPFQMTVEDD